MAESGPILSKWQGKASGKVRGTVEQVWPFVEDFCGLHKWLPAIDTCYRVEGEYGQPGLIRYCGVTKGKGTDNMITLWTLERLLTIDPVQRILSYDITDNNAGFHSYEATWKLISIEESDSDHGCLIEWSFIADPMDGRKFEDFLAFGESGILAVAEKIGKALQPQVS